MIALSPTPLLRPNRTWKPVMVQPQGWVNFVDDRGGQPVLQGWDLLLASGRNPQFLVGIQQYEPTIKG